MNKRATTIDEDGEVRELTAEDLRLFKPAHEALPSELQKTLGMRVCGLQKEPFKVPTICLSIKVLKAFWAGCDRWQKPTDAAIKDWLRTHSPV